MAEITIERRGAIITSVWPEEPTKAGVAAYFERAHEILGEGQPVVFVLDATQVKKVSGDVRELAVAELKGSAALRKSHLRGEAVVLSSALVRGVLAAMYMLSPPGYPAKTFSSVADAEVWAKGQVGVRMAG